MAAIYFLEVEDFFQKLKEPRMIEITHPEATAIGMGSVTRMPDVLACAVSSRLRNLRNSTNKCSFLVQEVSANFQPSFQDSRSSRFSGGIHGLLGIFVRWLYSPRIDLFNQGHSHLYYQTLWVLGQELGAPKFQDAVLRELCGPYTRDGSTVNSSSLTDEYGVTLVMECWDLTVEKDLDCDKYLSKDFNHPRHQHFWENKQMLKFILDFMVACGLEDGTVSDVIFRGVALAIVLTKLISEAAKSNAGRRACPPWAPEKFNDYLLDENIRT